MESKQTVLVTGACGYVGQRIAKDLTSLYRVIGFDIARPLVEQAIKGVDYVVGDLQHLQAILDACLLYKPFAIVHLAVSSGQTCWIDAVMWWMLIGF